MRTIIVRDSEGNQLATALASVGERQSLTLERVTSGKGHLLQHYFARGLRLVTVDSGEFRLRGTLSTAWMGAERRWFVALSPFLPRYESVPEPNWHARPGTPASE